MSAWRVDRIDGFGDGRVTIKDFYADVPAFRPTRSACWTAFPIPARRCSTCWCQPAGRGRPYPAGGFEPPAFSIHTMQGGEAGGVIAARATAQIAMRLVVENKPQVMIDRVIDHIRAEGYFVVDHDPDTATLAAHPRVAKITYRVPRDGESGAWRTDPNLPTVLSVRDTLEHSSHGELVEIRTLGGSGPQRLSFRYAPAGCRPVAGQLDDNQHTNNENLRLGNLWDGSLRFPLFLGSRDRGKVEKLTGKISLQLCHLITGA